VGTIVGLDTRASIERQARQWLIRMDGDEPLTSAEKEALREWGSRSSRRREELVRVCKLWRDANVLDTVTSLLDDKTPVSGGARKRWIGTAVAASVVLALVISTGWYVQRSHGVANETYATAIGQQRTVVLRDGSSVELNTDSRVQVNYDDHVRGIVLLRGEALFTVKPDANRPFTVHAADRVVRAVGTAFIVRLESGNVYVTVTKGVVDVAKPDADQPLASVGERKVAPSLARLGRLKAGQTTRFARGSNQIDVLQLPEPELERQQAWSKGILVFTGESLGEVVTQLNRYSTDRFEIDDPELASMTVGGRFRIRDLDAVLDSLHTSFGIRSRRVGPHVIRLEAEPRLAQ
jgi:transmembrane sensor